MIPIDDNGAGADNGWNSRTEALIGAEGVEKLRSARVLVVGLGGVGGYAAEMLLRSGVGSLTLVDADTVSISNLNRQLIATLSTVGQQKAVLFADRFHDINPECSITALPTYLTADGAADLLSAGYDFVVDAIDTVAPKVALLAECLRSRIPVVSSMGAGGRLDPTRVMLTDLWETRDDGLAKAVRQRLRKMGIRGKLKVVASSEPPRRSSLIEVCEANKRTSAGTLAGVPAVFGIFMASYVIRRLLGE